MKNLDVLVKYDYITCDLSPSYKLTVKNIFYLTDSIIVHITDKNIYSLRVAAVFKELWIRDKYYLENEYDDRVIYKKKPFVEKSRLSISSYLSKNNQK
ncbi:hypothetical protein [Paraclostridium tenue]|uniref:Uncharacterized protein n=1 Tax=Paraclostridium tenue TaxID=1737 RepID=A0ABN1MAY4_9FIRM